MVSYAKRFFKVEHDRKTLAISHVMGQEGFKKLKGEEIRNPTNLEIRILEESKLSRKGLTPGIMLAKKNQRKLIENLKKKNETFLQRFIWN